MTRATTRCDDSAEISPRPVSPFPPFDANYASILRFRRSFGVNLGSVFVSEKWMSPSIFPLNATSELDVASGWGSTSCASQILENHWATSITEQDLYNLRSIGINSVRIPIGYWTLCGAQAELCDNTAFEPVAAVYTNAWSYLVDLINLAAEYDIGVLVDLHGAPGSQNGQPHSGISDRHTSMFSDSASWDKTIDVLKFLVEQLCEVTNVVGIEVLNEPANDKQLWNFYTQAIDAMRSVSSCAQTLPLYIHDAFDLQRYAPFVAQRNDFVVLDHHSYFVFTAEESNESASNLTQKLLTVVQPTLANPSLRGNLVIDEWSCALTPRSLSYESDPQAARKTFCETQQAVYQNTSAGWSFWSLHLEQCHADWCFTAAVGRALPATFFPQKSYALDNGGGRRRRDEVERRFAVIAARWKRDSGDPHQRSWNLGYSDGMETGDRFAAAGSQLGFVGQFMLEQIQTHGQDVTPGTEPDYQDGFREGLFDSQ
uniref:Glycoside hydrolase n=1 Tax=Mycena chlorophos TaxID=658473 RepID=A0ABQ0L7U4_MYCCL|nr:glycoside hydrolase [Mycena chlorophos]